MHKPSMLNHELDCIFLSDYELTLVKYNIDFCRTRSLQKESKLLSCSWNSFLQPVLTYCPLIHSDQRTRDSFRNYRDIILSDNLHHSTQTIFPVSRQHNACHCSDLPWVGVRAFYVNVLQLMVGFYSSYSKMVPKVLSFWLSDMHHIKWTHL